MAYEWNADNRAKLLAASDEELARLFPDAAFETLKRAQRRFRNEILETSASEDDDEEVIVEENRKDREILRLRDEIAHLRKLYKTQSKNSAAMDAILDAIREVAPTMSPVKAPKLIVPKPGIEHESLVLLLGDIHFGEVVDIRETGGISVYNMDIAERRFKKTIERCISIAQSKLQGYYFDTLHIFALGDIVSGIIHQELLVHDELGIVEQALEATRIVAEGLLLLCQAFPRVKFTGVVGNHGRVTQEKYFKGKAPNNWDFLVYKYLERLLANQSNLSFNNPRSFFAVEQVENSTFLISHGDTVKSWNGIPFYGLSRDYSKRRVLGIDFDMDFQHMVCGHFHTPNIMSMQRHKLIVNGCLKGGDEYSLGAIGAAGDPVQLMFGVHSRKGLTHFWEINTSDVR